MDFSPEDLRNVEDFFSSIANHRDAYQYPTFCYLAVKKDDRFLLIQGRVFLNTSPSSIPLSHFTTMNIRAGCYHLSELGWDLTSLMDNITKQEIATPHGPLWFPAGVHGASPSFGERYGTSYAPFPPRG
jgi:hypothetical protein